MNFIYTKHAEDRIDKRGTNKKEVETAIKTGVRHPDFFNRLKFIQIFNYNNNRAGIYYKFKQVEVSAESVNTNDWKIITVIVKFY